MPECSATIDISAPAAVVWGVMTDLSGYRAWNPFVVGMELLDAAPAPAIGGRLRLHVDMDGKPTTALERIEAWRPPAAGPGAPPAEMTYEFQGALHRLRLVRGRRTQRLVTLDTHTTRYETNEVFSGMLTAFLPITAIQAGFDAHAQALKARAESLHAAGSAG